MTNREAIEYIRRMRDKFITNKPLEACDLAISALEKQEQANTQNINSTHTSRPNTLESLNILERVKDDKGNVPMSLVRQAFRNILEQAVDKCCETCKHKDRLVSEWRCSECFRVSNLEDYWEPYTEEES